MALDTGKATVILRDITVKFDMAVQTATPFYPQVCNVVPSDGRDEKYGMLGSMPGVREWLGERAFNELRAANFVLSNKHWEDSLLIPKVDIEDDRLGFYATLLSQLGVEAAYHPDDLLFTLVTGGETGVCFDGQYFFDTDHSWGSSGTQSNSITYDAASPTAVTVAEWKAAYHQARKQLLGFVNDNGNLLNGRPIVNPQRALMAVVPLEQEQVANEATKATIISNTSNVILDQPTIVATAKMSATKFDLYQLGGMLKPYIFQARRPLSRGMKGLDDLETKDVKFMTEARYNVGYFAWWTAVRTTFN